MTGAVAAILQPCSQNLRMTIVFTAVQPGNMGYSKCLKQRKLMQGLLTEVTEERISQGNGEVPQLSPQKLAVSGHC